MDAARKRATLGEISMALEKVWGRYRGNNAHHLPGSTRPKAQTAGEFKKAQQMVEEFEQAKAAGRASWSPRWGRMATIAAPKVIATAFADMGFDVDIGPLFQTPREVARHAVENDVHVVGRLLAGRRPQDAGAAVDQRTARLLDRDDILVVVGGVIPPQDYEFLYEAGVGGVFGPGTVIPVAAQKILEMLSGASVADVADARGVEWKARCTFVPGAQRRSAPQLLPEAPPPSPHARRNTSTASSAATAPSWPRPSR